MRRRLLSLLLAFVMVLGMLPVSTFAAAVNLPVSKGTVDIIDTPLGAGTLNTMSVYEQTTNYSNINYLDIESATQDGTVINVVFAETVAPTTKIQFGLSGSVSPVNHSGNKLELSDGIGTATCTVTHRMSGASVTFTINFSIASGETCTHENTTTEYERIDGEEKHTVTVACSDCNLQVSQTTAVCTDENSDYMCDSCGGSITCPHANTSTAITRSSDAEEHTTTVTCEDCSKLVSQKTEDCVDEDDDLICDVCNGTLVDPKEGCQTITAPSEAVVTVYYQSMYYKASVVEPADTVVNENGTTTYYYKCSESSDNSKGYAYRATYGDNIVKAGYMYDKPAVTLEWNDSKSPDYDDTTYETPNYILSGQTRSSIGDGVYMNVNSSGHLVLSSGATKELGAFRVWEIINHDSGNLIIQPDFHFTRVAGEDIYSLSPISAASAYGNNWQTLTAKGSGTAFLEVTYDAIHIVTGAESKAFSGSYGHLSDYVYNASDPTQTGLLVVQTDGKAADDVSFGIEGKSWDAELDTYYFYGNTGSLNLTPSATSGIGSVEVSNDKGSTWKTLTADDNDNYVADVVAGNNIIRVTNGNGQTAYQVVRAIKLDVEIQNLTDTTAGSSYKPGDTVRVIFDGLIRPLYKMSGIYNPQQNSVQFTGTDNTTYKTTNVNAYFFGVPFSYKGNDHYYTSFDVTLPSSQTNVDEDGNFVLSNGHFYMKGYIGNGNEHRSKLSYNGVPINGTAPETTKNRAVFEDIVLPLFQEEENHHPVLTGEANIATEMRLNDWYELDLADYFTDADDDELKYYVMDGTDDWVELTDSNYLYFPTGTGEQTTAFIALDGSMTLADVNDETPMLMLTATVEAPENEVTVTFSVTQGTDKFYKSQADFILTPQQITVPYFDLSAYGLTKYYYNPRCYASYNGEMGTGTGGSQDTAEGVVTTLHAFIWATEKYQIGMPDQDLGTGLSYKDGTLSQYFSIDQNAGSSFVNLWNGTNANYYLNMDYPMGRPGTGSTCDQQALYDGDVISIHMIENLVVTGSSFAALVVDENGQYDYATDATEATVAKGDTITLTAYQSVTDWESNTTSYVPVTEAEVVYTNTYNFGADTSDWTKMEITPNENGQIQINTSEMAGDTYYIAVQGIVDNDASKERQVAMFKLTVTDDSAGDAEIIYGDADGNGTVQAADALLIKQKVAEFDVTLNETAADVDGINGVQAADALLIEQRVAELIQSFPVEEVEE